MFPDKSNYVKAAMAIKAEGVCNPSATLKTRSTLSRDAAMAVLPLSLQPIMQYHKQIHQPHLMKAANASIQQALDMAFHLIKGIELLTAAAYSLDPGTFQGPALGPEMVAQPARLKGFGLRPEG